MAGLDLSCRVNRQNRPAELMAKFLDAKLKGEKGMSDDDVEGVLDKVMVLFRYSRYSINIAVDIYQVRNSMCSHGRLASAGTVLVVYYGCRR